MNIGEFQALLLERFLFGAALFQIERNAGLFTLLASQPNTVDAVLVVRVVLDTQAVPAFERVQQLHDLTVVLGRGSAALGEAKVRS